MLQWLLVAGYSALFLWIIQRSVFFRLENIPIRWIQLAFLAKVTAGCFVGWMYYVHYRDVTTADTIKFFDDGNLLYETHRTNLRHFLMMLTGIGGRSPELLPYYEKMSAWLNTDVLFNDNKTIIRANAFFRFFSLGNYYVHVVFINVFSYTGLLALFKLFSRYLPGKERMLFVALFLYPSLMIWGSGLLKDGLLLFALGGLLLSFDGLLKRVNLKRNIPVFLLCLFMLLFTKFYVITAVCPGLIAWYLSRKTTGLKTALIYLSTYVFFIALGFNINRISDRWDVADMIYWKQHNFNAQADIMKPGSRITIPELEPGVMGILKQAPLGLIRCIVRPGLMDDLSNPMVLLAVIENTLMLALSGYFFWKKSQLPLPEVFPVLLFCVFASCFI
ncbi:MAG: hypothetical protein ACKOQ6_01100, partial [Bacteroidota bacterium]